MKEKLCVLLILIVLPAGAQNQVTEASLLISDEVPPYGFNYSPLENQTDTKPLIQVDLADYSGIDLSSVDIRVADRKSTCSIGGSPCNLSLPFGNTTLVHLEYKPDEPLPERWICICVNASDIYGEQNTSSYCPPQGGTCPAPLLDKIYWFFGIPAISPNCSDFFPEPGSTVGATPEIAVNVTDASNISRETLLFKIQWDGEERIINVSGYASPIENGYRVSYKDMTFPSSQVNISVHAKDIWGIGGWICGWSFRVEVPVVETPPPAVAAAAPPVAPPVLTPPPPKVIKFESISVLEEVIPARTSTSRILLANPSEKELRFRTEISGIPPEWILLPDEIVLPPEGKMEVFLVASIPENAIPGDYKVALKLVSKELTEENFFILRVKPYPRDYDKPMITRKISIDREAGRTDFHFKVENAGRPADRLDLIERIPKSIAGHVDELKFFPEPSEIIEPDPVVKWVLHDLLPYEVRTVSYQVSRILDEYSPYVYLSTWQVTVIYRLPELVRISEVEIPTLSPGREGEMKIILRNFANKSLNLTAELLLPEGWRIYPEKIEERIPPEENVSLSWKITPAEEAVGVYAVILSILADGMERTDELSVLVSVPVGVPPEILYILPLFIFLALGLWIKRRTEEAKRRERIRLLRRVR